MTHHHDGQVGVGRQMQGCWDGCFGYWDALHAETTHAWTTHSADYWLTPSRGKCKEMQNRREMQRWWRGCFGTTLGCARCLRRLHTQHERPVCHTICLHVRRTDCPAAGCGTCWNNYLAALNAWAARPGYWLGLYNLTGEAGEAMGEDVAKACES